MESETNLIARPGEFINQRTGQPYTGPYHMHNGQAMVGAQHTSLPHDKLTRVQNQFSRVRTKNKKTTIVENHHHTYIIDGRGNGRTARECHPQNPNICHSHRIINYRVEEASSECYPNCTGLGAPGLGNHSHEITLGTEELLRQEQLRKKVTRFKTTPSIHMGRQRFVNKQRRLAAKTPGSNPDSSNPSLPPINPGDSGIGDDLGFDDFNPDSGGSTNPGGNTGGGSGGSGGSGGNTGGGGY